MNDERAEWSEKRLSPTIWHVVRCVVGDSDKESTAAQRTRKWRALKKRTENSTFTSSLCLFVTHSSARFDSWLKFSTTSDKQQKKEKDDSRRLLRGYHCFSLCYFVFISKKRLFTVLASRSWNGCSIRSCTNRETDFFILFFERNHFDRKRIDRSRC